MAVVPTYIVTCDDMILIDNHYTCIVFGAKYSLYQRHRRVRFSCFDFYYVNYVGICVNCSEYVTDLFTICELNESFSFNLRLRTKTALFHLDKVPKLN